MVLPLAISPFQHIPTNWKAIAASGSISWISESSGGNLILADRATDADILTADNQVLL